MPRKLPPFVVCERSRHGKMVFYFRRGKGARVRLPDLRSHDFHAAYGALLSGGVPYEPDVREMPVTPVSGRRLRTEMALPKILVGARARAVKQMVPFNLSVDQVLKLAEEQEFRCSMTGIEFYSKYDGPQTRINPFAPSVDRRVPALGYVPGNVRLVIFAVNAMLMDWGDDLFFQVANSYRYWRRRYGGASKNSLAPKATGAGA